MTHTPATDPVSAREFATRLFNRAAQAGMLEPRHPGNTPLTRQIETTARNWVETVRAQLDTAPPGDALDLIVSYDLVHRVAYRRPADTDTVNRCVMRAFEAHLHGDTTVDKYALYRTVAQQLRARNTVFFGRPLQWASAMLAKWYANFRTGISEVAQPAYDTRQQVDILLGENLRAFDPDPALYKHRLTLLQPL